jgi:hypothetical protein
VHTRRWADETVLKALCRDENIFKKVLKFSLPNLANDKRILNCGSLCREK